MNCQNVRDRLPLYSGGEISKWQKMIVGRHLRDCCDCQQELLKLEKTRMIAVDAVEKVSVIEDDPMLWKKLLYRLPKEDRVQLKGQGYFKKSVYRRLVPLLVGVTAVLMMFLLKENPHSLDLHVHEGRHFATTYPVVEPIPKPGVTVMTFQTADPKIKIVWFFEEENKS